MSTSFHNRFAAVTNATHPLHCCYCLRSTGPVPFFSTSYSGALSEAAAAPSALSDWIDTYFTLTHFFYSFPSISTAAPPWWDDWKAIHPAHVSCPCEIDRLALWGGGGGEISERGFAMLHHYKVLADPSARYAQPRSSWSLLDSIAVPCNSSGSPSLHVPH